MASIFLLDYARTKYEIILVDGGSTDETLKIASIFDGVKLLSSSNYSISNSRNIGARAAGSENLVFVDSDCLVDKHLLHKSYEYLMSYECCGGFYKPHQSHGWVSKVWLVLEQKPAGLVKWMTAGTLVVRKQSFNLVGGFSEHLHTGEDVELGMKLERNNFKIINDPSIGSIHLGQADNLIDFFMKEMWRGRSLIDGLMDLRKRSIRGIFFDLIILLNFILSIGLLVSLLSFNFKFTITIITLLLLVPLILCIRKYTTIGVHFSFLNAFILYTLYLLARSSSILYYNQVKKIFRKEHITDAEN